MLQRKYKTYSIIVILQHKNGFKQISSGAYPQTKLSNDVHADDYSLQIGVT